MEMESATFSEWMAVIFVCLLFVAIAILVLRFYRWVGYGVVEFFDRQFEWNNKQGWIENTLIVVLWPPFMLGVGIGAGIKEISLYLWKAPLRLYRWWDGKPDTYRKR